MCPACLTAAAVTVAGATTSGGVAAVVIGKVWRVLRGGKKRSL